MKLNFKDNEFNEYIRLTLLAVLVGFVAGLASVFFKIIKEGDRLVVAGLSDNLTKIIQKGL